LNLFVAAAIAFSPAASLAAQPAQAVTAAALDLSKIRIDNFGRVSTTYYRGEQPKGHDYAELAALGVKMVIDLQKDGDPSEPELVRRAGMAFHRIPMTTHEPPTSEQLAAFLELVNDPSNQPVYVHCAGGRHRTGVMTAAYRMTNEGWTADQAFKEMKQYKFGADILHPEFKHFVYEYPAQLSVVTAASSPTKTDR
jgi:tyrosine-protein phosphatase SIW14